MPDIVGVWKSGGYGTTVWFHELSCGHIVSARRKSTKLSLPCEVCDQLSTLPAEQAVSVEGRDEVVVGRVDVQADAMAEWIERDARVRVLLAARLGVPEECVRLVDQPTGPPGAVVTLMPRQVSDFIDRG